MITTYNTAVTDTASDILGKERYRKIPGYPEMFSTSVMRGEVCKRGGMKKKAQKNTEKLTRGSEGPVESERGLERHSLQGDWSFPDQ